MLLLPYDAQSKPVEGNAVNQGGGVQDKQKQDLLECAEKNDVAGVLDLLKGKADVDARDEVVCVYFRD